MKVLFKATLSEIAEACSGKIVSGDPDMIINTISTDSRDTGQESLFIPIIGEKFDGHAFIKELVENGRISSFLSMKPGYEDVAKENSVPMIMCEDTLAALGAIAAWHRNVVNPELIGITGTNGKTTTKELICAILELTRPTLKNEKNYNNEIGVPFTLLNLNSNHRTAVIEMGMNHSGELKRLSGISKPDIALITNVGEGHLEFLGTVENVALAKAEIMFGMEPGSVVIVNRDTECFDLLQEQAEKMKLVLKTFGLSDNADISPDNFKLKNDSIDLVYKSEMLSVPLYGIHNVYNIIAAIAVAEELEIDFSVIRNALSGFKNIDGRSQIIDRGYIIIDDTYNSNPLSSRYALESVSKIYTGKRKFAVLSDMKELGESSGSFHRSIGKLVAELGFDRMFVWGDMAQSYADGALKSGMSKNNITVFSMKQDLIACVLETVSADDVILVKGSRSMKMEEITDALIKKGDL